MWLFTRYGFYSIACAAKTDGSLDTQTVMVRARCVSHLRNLQNRFPILANRDILTLPNRDYRYRVILPKEQWVAILAELAQEQEWSNFKNEVARYQRAEGSEYAGCLHEVWAVMRELQNKRK